MCPNIFHIFWPCPVVVIISDFYCSWLGFWEFWPAKFCLGRWKFGRFFGKNFGHKPKLCPFWSITSAGASGVAWKPSFQYGLVLVSLLSVEVQSNLFHQWLHQSAERNCYNVLPRMATKLDAFMKGQFAIHLIFVVMVATSNSNMPFLGKLYCHACTAMMDSSWIPLFQLFFNIQSPSRWSHPISGNIFSDVNVALRWMKKLKVPIDVNNKAFHFITS